MENIKLTAKISAVTQEKVLLEIYGPQKCSHQKPAIEFSYSEFVAFWRGTEEAFIWKGLFLVGAIITYASNNNPDELCPSYREGFGRRAMPQPPIPPPEPDVEMIKEGQIKRK